MIEFRRPSKPASSAPLSVKILGLGGAGSNTLDRLMLDGIENADLVVLNTDAQALSGSVVAGKVQLGRGVTRGLGTGGDPEMGYNAAMEASAEIKAAVEGASLVFLVAGLGGGTGSGSAPLIASFARQAGAVVVAFATLPFSFEGKRRMAQAVEALESLRQYADAVICFSNDQLGDLCEPGDGVQEAFGMADATLSQSIRSIARLVQCPGVMRVGLDDLQAVLRGHNARCIFGHGEAEGDNRAHLALERALKSPLLDRGRLLDSAQNVLVHIVGGPDTTLNEVQILMDELNRHISDHTQILFGSAIDPSMAGRMSVMLLSALGDEPAAARPAPAARPSQAPVAVESAPPPARTAPVHEPEPVEEAPQEEPGRPVAEAEEPEPEEPAEVEEVEEEAPMPAAATTPARGKQEQMLFEPIARGRFEKSEPTIVDGEDLDVPAFMRRKIRQK